MKPAIPQEEWVYSGHAACAGCGAVQALRFVLKGLGKRTMLVIVASCSTPILGNFPFSAIKVPLMHIVFQTEEDILEIQADADQISEKRNF
jgi:pyruvate/2-oxoacid:ferredoxin oxidoreductase beta subunit